MVWVQTKPFILITECKQMTDLFHLFGEISGRVLSIPLDVLAWSSWEHHKTSRPIFLYRKPKGLVSANPAGTHTDPSSFIH